MSTGNGHRLAVALHAFYPELLPGILSGLLRADCTLKLFVTTGADNLDAVEASLRQSGLAYHLAGVENRGRDVLPFLKVLPLINGERFTAVMKVHTKRSPHRRDGDQWRDDVLGSLLDPSFLHGALDAIEGDPCLGMIGPAGHFLPMSTYFGANADRILNIGGRLSLSEEQIRSQGFFAGTMFLARASTLNPLLGLGFDSDDFEPEQGQKDGTLAHAIERVMALSVTASGMWIASTDDLMSPASTSGKYSYAKRRRTLPGPLGGAYEGLRSIERAARPVVKAWLRF